MRMTSGRVARGAWREKMPPVGAVFWSRLVLFVLLLIATPTHANDSWSQLQKYYRSPKEPVAVVQKLPQHSAVTSTLAAQDDPWSILQTYYVPFTQEDENRASTNPTARRKVAGFLHDKLATYQTIINDAAQRFNIPPTVLGAVIMVESAGNPNARAESSSAKGLMQTIKSTFAGARAGLKAKGIDIPNDPYNPKASILAGSWYLDRMFHQMERDSGRRFDRNDLVAWRKVAEYYYAGPTHGRKRAGVVIMYAGGKRVVVDKAGYSQKVMKWARVLG
jgi:soluble lytic murein transglycosylase-like protein